MASVLMRDRWISIAGSRLFILLLAHLRSTRLGNRGRKQKSDIHSLDAHVSLIQRRTFLSELPPISHTRAVMVWYIINLILQAAILFNIYLYPLSSRELIFI